MTNDVNLEFSAKTDTGRVRLQNEDCVAICPEYGLAILADGMGGYSAGEVASRIAVDAVISILERRLAGSRAAVADSRPVQAIAQLLDEAIHAANGAVLEAADTQPKYAGMGTTIVAAVIRDGRITIAHVGDSRAYRYRAGKLVQLTRDHSLLQEQIDAGLIEPKWVRFAQNKNLVTRAVGVDAEMDVEVHDYDAQPDDVYLLCSDGLSDMLMSEEIEEILSRQAGTLKSRCESLVKQANYNGGYDNISVVLINLQSSQQEQPCFLGRVWSWIS
ncbi:Stp1/IreP family PP2C-type Ser/Thr phosphatase [Noviherbaspirillum agri]